MKRYWVSWWEPAPGGDARPLVVPPKEVVPAYWISGERGWSDEETEMSICAVIVAEDEPGVEAVVKEYWRPGEWRFTYQKPDGWMPEGDRFK